MLRRTMPPCEGVAVRQANYAQQGGAERGKGEQARPGWVAEEGEEGQAMGGMLALAAAPVSDERQLGT